MAPNSNKRNGSTQTPATFTPDELALVLGISRNGVYTALRNGTIPHVRIGRRFVIPRKAVESWLVGIGTQMSSTGAIRH